MNKYTSFFCSLIPLVLVSVASFRCEVQAIGSSESGDGKANAELLKLPPGMQMDVFADESLVANPVAFSIDETGRVFVCETFRQGKGVEDNRKHMVWLEDDLAAQSVADRLTMFRKHLGEKVHDYSVFEDRVRLLVDTDQDTVADKVVTFADGFNEIEDGTGAGVLAINGDVYYTCIPNLWLLKDIDDDGHADVKKSLHSGYGVRVAFRGHDMHGLTLGPDGRIYFSIGDRGYNVLTQEGNRIHRPYCGAVFRCERDGSGLQEFAYGLRNPQELAFDDYGNLFTGDNNSDSGDLARLVYVLPESDSGWRMYYQYLDDRGPWNRERIWLPYRCDEKTTAVQPASILPPVANLADGPSGFVAYPGTGLPAQYNNHFFLADFYGTPALSGIRSFAVEKRGAGFTLQDSEWFIKGILATDVDFGFDGNMYISDWISGWNGTGKGRIVRLTSSSQEAATEIAELLQVGLEKLSSIELVNLLEHDDRRVRQRAQFALVERGEVGPLVEISFANDRDVLARIHAIWGLGQLLRKKKVNAVDILPLLTDPHAEIRRNAIVVLGDGHSQQAVPYLIHALHEKDASKCSFSEKAAAAIALGRIARHEKKTLSQAVPALLDVLAENHNVDPVLRCAVCSSLSLCATVEQLVQCVSDTRQPVRLGAVVALAKMHSSRLGVFLHDIDAQVVIEAARGLYGNGDEESVRMLSELAGKPNISNSVRRYAVAASFRRGGLPEAEMVLTIAADPKVSADVRVEAMDALMAWEEPSNIDRLSGQYRPVQKREGLDLTQFLSGQLVGIFNGPAKVTIKAAELVAFFHVEVAIDLLTSKVGNEGEDPDVRAACLESLFDLHDQDLADSIRSLVRDDDAAVRKVARRILATIEPLAAIAESEYVLQGDSTDEQQQVIQMLVQMNSVKADDVLMKALQFQLMSDENIAIRLDLLEAARERGERSLVDLARELDNRRNPENPLGNYAECLSGGNAKQGEKVFFKNQKVNCVRCHMVNERGGNVGPNLSKVGREKTAEYLLESIVLPSAKISPGYSTVQFLMATGRVQSGIVKEEASGHFIVEDAEGKRTTLLKEDIDEMQAGLSGMPADLVKQLSKRQVRDLVAYLGTLEEETKRSAHVE
jgi:quinoprotein glucose dehydrogenase